MSDFLLYTLGLRDALELDEMVRQFLNEETVETPSSIGTYSYDDILGTTFRLVNSADCYEYDSQYQVWKDKSDNEDYMKKLVANGEKLTITGIVQPSPDSAASALTAGINYPASLTRPRCGGSKEIRDCETADGGLLHRCLYESGIRHRGSEQRS